MKIIKELIRSELPTSTALGYFDGVHIGHRAVIGEAVATARCSGLVPTVFTLLQSPRTVLRGEESCNILMTEKKLQILSSLGVEQVYLIDFRTIKDITAGEFVENIVHGIFNATHISCGFNYHFGAGALGSGEMLEGMCSRFGISVLARPRIILGGQPVSSTRIRECIRRGDVRQANEMLGSRYGYCLPVIHGRQLGRTIGIPTLNMEFPQGLVCPRYGAYASVVRIADREYFGVTDIGVKPTVGSQKVIVETWMPDYSGGELYGEELSVELLDFIRPERKFPDVEALKNEIVNNAAQARNIYDDIGK